MDTLEEVKLLLKELVASQKETDLKFKETDSELKETSRLVKELTRNINGIADSNGLTAEQFFSSALERSPALNGVSFDYAERDEKRHNKQLSMREQYDVLLYSESAIGIVEIKYRLRSSDIELLASRKVENFRVLFPQEAAKDIYLAAAGFSVDEQAIEKARELGVYVLTQVGENIKILNEEARIY
ncbi:MAG: hypothetical protein U0264_09510 [Candidatus Kapaibacterium sp.]